MFSKLVNVFRNTAPKQEKRIMSAAPTNDVLKSIMDSLPVHQEWLSDYEINKIMRDPKVISAMGSRKAATLKKELIIQTDKEEFAPMLASIFPYDTVRKVLDIPYHGVGVYELNWEYKDGYAIPRLIDRRYKEFLVFNQTLYFRPFGGLEPIPENKVVYATWEDDHSNPMGKPLVKTLFWYVKFKNSSLEFWVRFLEKYGSPWAVGKTDGDKDLMAQELYNMLAGDAAVVDLEDSVEIKTATQSGSFKEILEYIDDQINSCILGGNLTGSVRGGGSYAATNVHNNIREDIAMGDEKLLLHILNSTIEAFKRVNNLPTLSVSISLKDEDDPNLALAERDERITNMGYRPTQEYIQRTYNIQVNPIEDQKNVIPNSLQKIYALSATKPIKNLNDVNNAVDTNAIALSFQTQILDIVDSATTFDEALDALYKAYPTLDTIALQDALDSAMQSSYILGTADVEFEEEQD